MRQSMHIFDLDNLLKVLVVKDKLVNSDGNKLPISKA